MKLTVLLIFIGCMHVSANGFSQETKVTLKMENATLRKLFLTLEKQTDYRFVYSNSRIPGDLLVNINVKEEPIGKVLIMALSKTELTYKLLENLIVITDKGSDLPEVVVRGKIVTPDGEPLAGVSIKVKGTTKGTATDIRGEFVLPNVDENATLVVSSVGFETQEIKLNSRTTLNITMQVQVNSLGDVVVEANTGYQKISKERATGSFNTIGRDQLEKPSISIAQRLIGTTAGVQANLDVDGNPSFQIRGLTSLGSSADPLIIVDGFPIQGNFNSINPNDVESVTILKDAAAASIWGARAGNGVIVITTRNARKGVPLKVEFSAFTRIGAKFDLDYVRPLASSAETVAYEKMAFNKWSARVNTGSFQSDYGKSWSLATVAMSEHYLGYITEAERDATLAQLAAQDNRGQINDYLLSNPVNQQYNLSLFGSSGKMSNSLSLMFSDNQSNFKETYNKSYLANYRTTASVFKWLDVNLSAMLQYNEAHNNGVDLGDIQGLSPYEMLVNPDGSQTNIHQYYWPVMERHVPMDLFPYADWTYNPIREMQNRDLKTTSLNTRIQAGLTFKLLEGLTFDSKLQYELFNTNNRNQYGENTFYVRRIVNQAATWDQSTNAITSNLPKGDILTQGRNQATTTVFRNQLSFNRRFTRRHEISFIAGTETNSIVRQSFGNPTAYGYNDATLTLGTFPNGPGGTFSPIKNWLGSNQTFSYTNSFSYSTDRYFSYYGNAAYTYNSKYTLSGSYRADASNLITDDPQYRYAPFWSVGLGWQISKEKFMYPVSWVDRMNVRLTYGYNGNVDRSTAFKPLISTTATPNIYTNDYVASISSYGNPTLRWEKTGTWNVGFDYSLFRGKLYGKIDVYNKSGKDLIAQLSIPAVNGTTSQKLNNAEMTNRGIELELGTSTRIRGNDIVWHSNLNFSYNKNKITKLFVANYAASTLMYGGTGAYVEGENANSLWRFEYAGVHNTQPMIKGEGHTLYDFGAWTPGDGRNYMLNMGTTVAPYTLGFINSFKVYDFNISFIITGKFGHIFETLPFNYPPTWTSRVLPNKKLTEVMNGDPDKIVPLPLNDDEPRYYFWDRFHQFLSYLTQSASHIRMQEVNVTYNLKPSLLSKFNMSRMLIYAQGNDLFTIMANDAGEDPEYQLGTMNPRPKLTLGVKFEF